MLHFTISKKNFCFNIKFAQIRLTTIIKFHRETEK